MTHAQRDGGAASRKHKQAGNDIWFEQEIQAQQPVHGNGAASRQSYACAATA